MQAVVTATEMAALDRACIKSMRIPGVVLMENAGRGIAEIAMDLLGETAGKRVLIACGPGNNGGDGYVVARHLANAGAEVTVWVISSRDKIRGDALINLEIWEKMGGQLHFLDTVPQRPSTPPDLVVDALLGTGVTGPLRGIFVELVMLLNELAAPILAVDIPTGVDADTGAVPGTAIHARVTATMALLKRGLLFSPGREYAGTVHIVDISMPATLIKTQKISTHFVDDFDVAQRLPRRQPDTHKNRVGTVGVIAGSVGFTGAAALTAMGALRGGCGLCYLAVAQSLLPILAGKLTEVITWPFEDRGTGYLLEADYESWKEQIASQSALAIGPGLGQHGETAVLVHRLLQEMHQPMVLDADGLNVSSKHLDLLKNYHGGLILTPHPGELARLLGVRTEEIAANRIKIAADTAKKLRQIIVLKGGPALIAAPDGSVYINSTGNAGMATAGSGDVLTGLIAGFLAQGTSTLDAALCGVYVHGLAGDLAKAQKGEMSLLAGDILDHLPQAITHLQRRYA